MTPQGRPRLEVPIFGPDSGALAASLGASRLELNHAGSYARGGTTPTLAELSALLSSLSTTTTTTTTTPRPTIRIMIRPRGPPPLPPPSSEGHQTPPQDFLYSPAELSTMAASIREFSASGLLDASRGDGFVFGLLRVNPLTGAVELDVEGNKALVGVAREGRGGRYKCVLHRAVDELLTGHGDGDGNVEGVMKGVERCGFDGVLTSAGRGSAVDNLGRMREVVEVAERVRVEVVVGGGVRRGNVRRLVEGLGGRDGVGEGVWFHSSCLGDGEMFDEEETSGLGEELTELGLLLSS